MFFSSWILKEHPECCKYTFQCPSHLNDNIIDIVHLRIKYGAFWIMCTSKITSLWWIQFLFFLTLAVAITQEYNGATDLLEKTLVKHKHLCLFHAIVILSSEIVKGSLTVNTLCTINAIFQRDPQPGYINPASTLLYFRDVY